MDGKKVYCNADVYDEVSDDLGIHPTIVAEIAKIQAEFTQKVIKDSAFEGVKWEYLGKFKAKLKFIQFTNEIIARNKNAGPRIINQLQSQLLRKYQNRFLSKDSDTNG